MICPAEFLSLPPSGTNMVALVGPWTRYGLLAYRALVILWLNGVACLWEVV